LTFAKAAFSRGIYFREFAEKLKFSSSKVIKKNI